MNGVSYHLVGYVLNKIIKEVLFPMNNYKEENLEKIDSAFICVVNSNVRHDHRLNSYAKLLCIELISLEYDREVRVSDESLCSLTGFPKQIVEESLDLLECFSFITITYLEEGRVITLEDKTL